MFSQMAELMQGNPELMRTMMQQGAGVKTSYIGTDVRNRCLCLLSAAAAAAGWWWYNGHDAESSIHADVLADDAEPPNA